MIPLLPSRPPSRITAVAFDPYWRPGGLSDAEANDGCYRILTAGADTNAALWELQFSDELLFDVEQSKASVAESASSSVLLPSIPRKYMTRMAPLIIHKVTLEPLTGIVPLPEAIVTSCSCGSLRSWMRPKDRQAQTVLQVAQQTPRIMGPTGGR